MTDEEALRIYDEFWGAHGSAWSANYDDDDRRSIADEVRAILAAPTLDSAVDVIAWWGAYSLDENSACCEAMRAKYDADGWLKPCGSSTTPAPPPPLPR